MLALLALALAHGVSSAAGSTSSSSFAAVGAAAGSDGDGSCPCPSHQGRTYCPLIKTPGQCDKASHPPCKPGGTCPPPAPPGPPGPPECHSVKVTKQTSSAKCVLGKTFGCNATGDSMWIEGCRGYFSCDGSPSFGCDIDGPGRHYCRCSGMPVPAPPGTPALHGCVDPAAVSLPYCNTSLSRPERLDDLMSRLSRLDKVSILTPSDPHADCGGQMGGAAEIGLPPWHWLTEVCYFQCYTRVFMLYKGTAPLLSFLKLPLAFLPSLSWQIPSFFTSKQLKTRPPFLFLQANTNIATDCIAPGKCPTLFGSL
jgi:hypothetical protein